jgi:yecA family protein
MTDQQLPPLTDEDRQALNVFLTHPDRPEGTLNHTQFIGFLYSVLCAPEFLTTEQWFPIVFNGESANAETQTDMQKIIVIMVQHYKEAFDDLMSGGCTPKINLTWSENTRNRMDLEYFCQGFIAGFTWMEARWKNAIEKFNALNPSIRGDLNIGDQIYAIMGLVSTLASPDLNIERAEEPELLQKNLPDFTAQLPIVIFTLAEMGGKLEELFQTLEESETNTH